MVGEIVAGRYRVLATLGQGGMGHVYLVENLAFARREALKVLRADLAADPMLARRFRRELRAVSRLNHEHIVGAYDCGVLETGAPFLTMEHVEGPTVAEALTQRGPFPLPEALWILTQLGRALVHAHGHGVLHRDLKPENLILVPRAGGRDRLKVLDFGIAKIVDPEYRTTGTALTGDGQIFGTPGYMAPELFSGEAIDGRTDLYAIGCIGYELVVGRPPFEGTPLQVTVAHLGAPPPRPSAALPGVPVAFDAWVARCMAKRAADRFRDAAELLAALARIPGFEEAPRRGAGAELERSAPALASSAVAEGDDERTFVDPSRAGREAASVAETTRLQPEDLAPVHQTTLRELCQVLLELDGSIQPLTHAFACLRAVEGELARIDGQLAALDARALEIEAHVKAQESALRAAMDELVDDAGRPAPSGPAVSGLASLEARLREELLEAGRRLDAVSEDAIGLVAERAAAEERLAAVYADLGAIADEALPRFVEDPRVEALAGRLASVACLIQGARVTAGR